MTAHSRFYAGAYWPARAEDVEACADRLERFMHRLATVDPLLARWYHTGYSEASVRRPFDACRPDLVAALLAGRNRRDSDRSVIEELGFSVGLWNGAPDASIGLRVSCGKSEPRLPNTVILELPKPLSVSATLSEDSTALSLVEAMVEAWEPDWATVTSDDLRDAQGPRRGGVVVGWMTYLSADRGPFGELNDGYRIEPVGEGLAVIVEGGPPTDPAVVVDLAARIGPDALASRRPS